MREKIFFFIFLCTTLTSLGQKICLDTAMRHVLYATGPDTSIIITKTYLLSGNNNLILGNVTINNAPLFSQASSFLAKTNNKHEVLWSKVLPISTTNLRFKEATILPSGHICLTADIASGQNIFAKWIFTLDVNGNLINVKDFRFTVPMPDIVEFHIQPNPDNSLTILSIFDGYNIPPGNGVEYWFTLAKYNPLTNTIYWSTAYKSASHFGAATLLNTSKYIYTFGGSGRQSFEPINKGALQLFKFDIQDGSMLVSKTAFFPGLQNKDVSIGFGSESLLWQNSANNFSCYYPGSAEADTACTVLSFDTLLNIIKSRFLKFKKENYGRRVNAAFDNNGNLLASSNRLNGTDKNAVVFIVDNALNLIEQKEYTFTYTTPPVNLMVSLSSPPVSLMKDGVYSVYNRSFTGGKFCAEIASSSLLSPLNGCGRKIIDSIEVKDFTFNTGAISFTLERNNVFQVRPASFSLVDLNLTHTQTCLSVTERRLSCGNDINICKGETASIKATGGFLNYNWTNKYNNRLINDSTIQVWPQKDTFYVVNATTGAGCTLTDTVFVTVKTATAFNLGSDTGFCKGDSLVLNAGNSFAQYEWNDGSKSPALTVKTPGIYFVTALNANGCYSKDTLRVMSLYDTPKVLLNSAGTLCINETDTLDPGVYKTYLWQDGRTTQKYKVTAKGIYTVAVSDDNGCKGTASAKIDNLVHGPSNYLIRDTFICKYQSIKLDVTNFSFTDLLWNTGSRQTVIEVSNPGTYSLKVTDTNSCTGLDTVVVSEKHCVNKIFFPNAFTPDGNHLNDFYKPTVEGLLISYKFSIYNRWGKEIFTTNNHLQGWDGKFNNIQQPQGGFIWKCSYQFAGEPVKFFKGQLLLLR